MPENKRLHVTFSQPASRWIEALPVGNGKLGAMVFGSFPTERIQVNQHTVWEGKYTLRVNPKGREALPDIRKALFDREYGKAQGLADKHMLAENKRLQPYQPLCDLLVSWLPPFGDVQDLCRDLDLATGIHRVTYQIWGKAFTRECFASLADGVLVARFTGDWDGANYLIRLDREQDVQLVEASGNQMTLAGQLGADGVRFLAQAMVLPEDGTVVAKKNALEIRNTKAFTIILAGESSYISADDLSADPAALCAAALARVQGKTYEQLREAHVALHQQQMGRVQLDLTSPDDRSDQTTGQRLANFTGDANRALSDESFKALGATPRDWDFYALLFQTCRYMLITSSQPGSMPSTLQGRWCGVMNPPWDCDYHPNINLQMNYWLANPTNLDSCNVPLFDWLKQIVRQGQDTARQLYGCDGWVMHHVSDIFANTGPMDGAFGVWPVGGAWMCQHIWEHYQFTCDHAFLSQTALPIMLESARFMLGFLVEAPQSTAFAGHLVTSPSHSPENFFFAPNGERAAFCVSATMDTQIISQLFRNCLAGLDVLGQNSPLKQPIADALKRLPPMQISPKTGRLMEWIEDFEEPEPGHRHMSHMFAIYPGDGITPRHNPDLVAAARKSIEYRLSHDYHATGWSLPWLGCIFARMGEGNKALEMLTQRIARFTMPNAMFSNAHGQPQVGDACGFAAAMVEMLLQSHEGFINVLPALPDQWSAGQVNGLKARGGFELDIVWQNGKATSVTVRSLAGNLCPIRVNGVLRNLTIPAGGSATVS